MLWRPRALSLAVPDAQPVRLRRAFSAPAEGSFDADDTGSASADSPPYTVAPAASRWRCLLACIEKKRVDVHPVGAQLADAKKQDCARGPYRSYAKLVREAGERLPRSTKEQIRMDVERTFCALPKATPESLWRWPEEMPMDERRDRLSRVLLALEYRNQCMSQEREAASKAPRDLPAAGITYVQGCNFMAAMCIGFLAGEEEDGYWLYAYLIDDVFGCPYFEPFPPLADYHGDRAAVSALVSSVCVRLTRALGGRRLAELVSTVASRCFLSGFVGFLSAEPLLALWAELLECPAENAPIPRLVMHRWLAGLMLSSEDCLLQAVQRADESEAVPLAFQKVQRLAQTRPEGWRPGIRISPRQLTCLRNAFQSGRAGFITKFEAQSQQERHADDMTATLQRTTMLVTDAMRCLEALDANAALDVNAAPS